MIAARHGLSFADIDTSPTLTTVVEDPVRLVTMLLITGAYPVVAYLTYVCAGLAVGRLDLSSNRVAGRLLAGGATAAVLAQLVSWILLHPVGGLGSSPPVAAGPRRATPGSRRPNSSWEPHQSSSWWYLALASPHAREHPARPDPHDGGRGGGPRRRAPAHGPIRRGPSAAARRDRGQHDARLYSAHLVLLTAGVQDKVPALFLLFLVVAGTGFAVLWRRRHAQGPLNGSRRWPPARVRRAAEPRRARPCAHPLPVIMQDPLSHALSAENHALSRMLWEVHDQQVLHDHGGGGRGKVLDHGVVSGRAARAASSGRCRPRRPQPIADLVDDGGGRLGDEGLVAELGASACVGSLRAAARSFSSRLRSAATSIAPDRSSSTVTPAGRRASRSARSRRRPGRAVASDRISASCAASPVRVEAGDPRRHPLARAQPLVGAEPADLGDQRLQRRRPRASAAASAARAAASGQRRPRRDHERLAAGQRGPQRLGDERHHRVQQPQHDVEHVAEHPPGDLGRRAPPAASGSLASSRYQSQTSSQAKW